MTTAPLIKICGVRTPADVDVCLEERVAFVGLNLHAPSPRFVGWADARDLCERLGTTSRAVAVLVRPSADEMQRAIDEVGVAVLQLHGVDAEYLQTFRPPGASVWLAHGVAGPEDLQALQAIIKVLRASEVCLAAVLIDAKVEGVAGGSGQRAPWSLLAQHAWETPLVLAGGLRPDNVAAAMAVVRPFCVDVASGVESRPGVKDARLIREFVQAVRRKR